MSNAALTAVFTHSKSEGLALLIMLSIADRADDQAVPFVVLATYAAEPMPSAATFSAHSNVCGKAASLKWSRARVFAVATATESPSTSGNTHLVAIRH